MSPDELDAIEARARAASPEPWLRGARTSLYGVRPGGLGCYGCGRNDTELVWEGRANVNGQVMDAHVHRYVELWDKYGIVSGTGESGPPTHVIVETVEYGVLSDENASFIVHARSDVPRLVARIRELEAKLEMVEW